MTTTKSFRTRYNRHKKKYGDISIKILKTGTKEEIDLAEEKFIADFNTFIPHGLNKTADGKGKAKYSTLGYKFSQESRKKMSLAARGRIPWNKGKTYNFRPEVSASRKGKQWRPPKLSEDEVVEIIELYRNKVPLDDARLGMIQRNGRPYSYEHAFAQKYGEIFGVTPSRVRQIINRKGWDHVWNRYSE